MRTSRIARILRRRPSRSGERGQAMVEFALVAPVFFLVIFVFLFLASIAFDRQAMIAAVRVGTAAGNQALGPVTERFAADPVLVTPAYGATRAIFASDNCNRDSVNAELVNRAWDWGCRYDAKSGASYVLTAVPDRNTHTDLAIQAPLIAALRATADRLSDMWLGGMPSDMSFSACYAYQNSKGAVTCLYTATARADGVVTAWKGKPTEADPAPTLLVIEAQTKSPYVPLISLHLPIAVTSTQALDRFLPSCPAPQSDSETGLTFDCRELH